MALQFHINSIFAKNLKGFIFNIEEEYMGDLRDDEEHRCEAAKILEVADGPEEEHDPAKRARVGEEPVVASRKGGAPSSSSSVAASSAWERSQAREREPITWVSRPACAGGKDRDTQCYCCGYNAGVALVENEECRQHAEKWSQRRAFGAKVELLEIRIANYYKMPRGHQSFVSQCRQFCGALKQAAIKQGFPGYTERFRADPNLRRQMEGHQGVRRKLALPSSDPSSPGPSTPKEHSRKHCIHLSSGSRTPSPRPRHR